MRMIRIIERLLGMAEKPKVVQSGWAGRHMRELLNDAQRGAHTEIHRYDTPEAVLVPYDWYEKAIQALKNH